MRVLAIDTALGACSTAVLDTDLGDVIAAESTVMSRGHAETIMPMIARVMERAGIGFSSLDRIAVTTGPGSFTGLRVGIAAARGIALAAGRPAIGLTTLSGFAAPHIAEDDSKTVVAVVDARHDHVYLQVSAPAVAPSSGAYRADPRSCACRSVGRGARCRQCRRPDRSVLVKRPIAPGTRRAARSPDISWVARLGAAATESHSPPKPLYLRAPDAQPQDAARLPRR